MQRDLTLVFGGDGTGKTQFVLRNILPRYSRVLILDAGFGDYTGALDFGSLDDLVAHLGSIEAFGTRTPFRVSYTPTPDEYDLMFLLARDLGDALIVAEEADRFSDMGLWETEYVYRGRHWNVSMVGITIQPYALPKDWRRIVKEIISFRQVEPSDIDYIASIIGESAYEIPKLAGPGQGAKPPFPYLRWTPSEGAKIENNGRKGAIVSEHSNPLRPAGPKPEDSDPPGDNPRPVDPGPPQAATHIDTQP